MLTCFGIRIPRRESWLCHLVSMNLNRVFVTLPQLLVCKVDKITSQLLTLRVRRQYLLNSKYSVNNNDYCHLHLLLFLIVGAQMTLGHLPSLLALKIPPFVIWGLCKLQLILDRSFRFKAYFLSMCFSDVAWPPSSGSCGKLNQNPEQKSLFFVSKIGF